MTRVLQQVVQWKIMPLCSQVDVRGPASHLSLALKENSTETDLHFSYSADLNEREQLFMSSSCVIISRSVINMFS